MKLITKLCPMCLLSLVIIMMFQGCSTDWLDIQPKGRFTEDDLPVGSLEAQVFAAYAGLRADGISGLPYVALHNIRSDDADLGSSPGDYAAAGPIYDDFNYPLSHWLVNDYWTGHFALINLTNNVMAAGDSLEVTTDLTIMNIGEAKFMRAWAYFNMVRTFGEVPLIDFRITDQASAIRPKSSINEIYTLIDDDLDEAITTLPESWDNYTGRINRGTALALKVKTLMARQRYAEALSYAQQIINSNQYSLVNSYESIFRESGENNSESIFEIRALFDGVRDFGINYANRQGVRGSGEWDLGWGWNIPNERLISVFEDGDPRLYATVLRSGSTTYDGQLVPTSLPRPYWNYKTYTSKALRDRYGSLTGNWFNMRIIRYADILLLAAEAANEVGGEANIDLALNYLEQVRARARGNNALILPAVSNREKEVLRNAIRHERQVELAMENERFYDLVRWEIDVETMHAAGHANYQIRNRFFPIPQPEIDRSNGVLIQNPDY